PKSAPRQRAKIKGAALEHSFLLTGGTGFLGAYLLRELFRKSPKQVVCLVRPCRNECGRKRLAQRFRWYFRADVDAYGDRLRVIEGDVTLPNFGLPEQQYREIAREINTVVHSAADVRLFTD